jgi:hypothetical protein
MQANFQQTHPLDGIVFSESVCPRALTATPVATPYYGGGKAKWRHHGHHAAPASSSKCILLSKVLTGRPYRVSGIFLVYAVMSMCYCVLTMLPDWICLFMVSGDSCLGVRAREGYESVLSNDGQQLAVYDNKQILPWYVTFPIVTCIY